ncbi:unnamed protein product [Ectocarpus sp. 13 AM-2016]
MSFYDACGPPIVCPTGGHCVMRDCVRDVWPRREKSTMLRIVGEAWSVIASVHESGRRSCCGMIVFRPTLAVLCFVILSLAVAHRPACERLLGFDLLTHVQR